MNAGQPAPAKGMSKAESLAASTDFEVWAYSTLKLSSRFGVPNRGNIERQADARER
jgi:hypothetical protein